MSDRIDEYKGKFRLREEKDFKYESSDEWAVIVCKCGESLGFTESGETRICECGEIYRYQTYVEVAVHEKVKGKLIDWAVIMYANEPCRICGELLTPEDILDDAVFVGYSKDNKSRSAHKECWEKNVPIEQWKYQ